ncbi:MAG: hypothetical protein COT39_01325 [Parcubacteria group bacterium CG08_land_8_20_14_0_20_48_21]|nr:MAG: hypothetical protein AUK21_01820 [Parcubacteria group bacterium CG2_30_48_51]PIS33093.1 MAG: hypothetical protein COT39_01325 [Parcubacteria group bacterium CG08_land_8_20_14_0_20_48_21]PIW79233.1 MAG: hypothetical protein COZ99_02310 [Parcubacteria group bacterium CG_4_8_14_3_um_filter_48_16]PIY78297.1 MAG: hypothetical protein COY83_00475 [Parcubacteria group bacterium CG_4_10_14_0_8_um_filter_48_154]PIZ77706.1 MAG: hypothetical protein COY03_01915 [bacterium CG_4_10_14_0_2_um_filter_
MQESYAEQLLEKTKIDYDRIARQFSETRQHSWPEFQLLEPYLKGIGRMLDVGCGNGRLYTFARRAVAAYEGIDYSSALIKKAQEETRGHTHTYFQVGDMRSLPYPDESFDLVVSIAALNHLPGNVFREKAVGEMVRVLQKGGTLFMSNWNLRSFKIIMRYGLWKGLVWKADVDWDRGDCAVPWRRGVFINRYYHAFTLRALRSLVECAGLTVTENFYTRGTHRAHVWNARNLITIAKKS